VTGHVVHVFYDPIDIFVFSWTLYIAVLVDIFEDKPEASKVPVLEADVNDPSSLAKMAQSARIILNCVGPVSLLHSFVSFFLLSF